MQRRPPARTASASPHHGLRCGLRRSLRCGLCSAALLLAGGAARAENCMARLLADVPALEAPEQVKSKSSGTFGPLSALKVDKKSGKMFYCAVGSYCYDSNAFQLTTPCRFKLDKSFGSSFNPYFVYSAR